MSNSKKTKEAEQRAKMAEEQTRAAQAEAERVRQSAATQAQETVKITPQAQMALDRAGNTLTALDSGNLTGVKGIMNFLNGVATARDAASRASATGSAALATDVANPNLLAMNQQRLNAESANQTAAGVDLLAKETERNAVNDIGNFSGMDLSAKTGAANFMFQNAGLAQNNAGLSNQVSNQAWDRYQFEKQHRGFWQNLATTAVGAGAQAVGAGLGSYFSRPKGGKA